MSVADVQVSAGERPLLVASTGGHLEELYLWARRWDLLGGAATWVTFENEQSSTLLADERVHYVPYVAPRDVRGTIAATRAINTLIDRYDPETLVSTGSAVGVSMAVAGRAARRRTVYIESLARVAGISTTGRIVSRIPRVERYVQNERLRHRSYEYRGSILDAYRRGPEQPSAQTPRRVLVTVGTIRPYGFDRAIRHLDSLLTDFDVTWQIGESTVEPSHGRVSRLLSRDTMVDEVQRADVVIAHAGVGSILMTLAAGKVPVILPRLARHAEHIDDHQLDIARLLGDRQLVHLSSPETLSLDDLALAHRQSIVTADPGSDAAKDEGKAFHA